MARHPPISRTVALGRCLPPHPDADVERRLSVTWGAKPEGSWIATAVTDGTTRVGAWRLLPDWGVVATSSITKDEALRPWRAFLLYSGLVAGFASLVLGALVGNLSRAQRRLQRANLDLEGRIAERTVALRHSEQELAAEVTALKQLQVVSTAFVQEDRVELVLDLILEAARMLMRADCASIQMFDAKREQLVLLGAHGFHEESAAFWMRVEAGSRSTCGAALAHRERVIIEDLEASTFVAGTGDLDAYRKSGIRAVQSTPLVARSSRMLGMISTHWRDVHAPSERDLRLFDVLARQAADVLERTQAAADLRGSERRLGAVLHALPIGIALINRDRKVILANEVYRRYVPEVVPSRDNDQHALWEGHDEAGAPVECTAFPVARALRGDRVWPGIEFLFHGDEGRGPVWTRVAAVPFRDETGSVVGATVVIDDIDLDKRAEIALAESREQFRRLNEELEARVAQEVASREEAQARLAHAQRMEALGQLAGGIAHDFNNVLQAVQGGARLIEQRPGDVERTRRLVGMMAEAAGRGAAITRRLLAFSRRADLRAEPLDAAELLGGLAEVLAHTMGDGIRAAVAVPAGLPPLVADKGQIETVLVNLAANARDAMAGQGTITLGAELVPVAADGPRPPVGLPAGEYLRLSVADTGTGMTPEVLARVTEPFFTTKPHGKGTGLGLAMARGFVEQSGGALHIESAPGAGTTVSLWLPGAGAALQAVVPVPAGGPVGDVARATVLFVDDEPTVREIVAEGLRAAGYDVTAAAGAVEALELFDAGEPVDVLVSDLSMPGVDGLVLVDEVHRRQPGLPAILLTGFATDAAELAMQGAVSGAFSLLRKPIEAQALAERIAALLSGAEASAGCAGSTFGRANHSSAVPRAPTPPQARKAGL